MSELSHVDEGGAVHMVDVGGKPLSRRRAVARGEVHMHESTVRRLRELPKGDALTTGGTGLAARDVTPEATLAVLEREAPGIPEALRADSLAKTPHGLLSRGTAGTVGRTLVVNFAGSPGACRDGYAVLKPALPHALKLLADQRTATDHVHT